MSYTSEIVVSDLGGMCNLALQPLKIYLRCHNANGHQTWHGGDLPQDSSNHKVT